MSISTIVMSSKAFMSNIFPHWPLPPRNVVSISFTKTVEIVEVEPTLLPSGGGGELMARALFTSMLFVYILLLLLLVVEEEVVSPFGFTFTAVLLLHSPVVPDAGIGIASGVYWYWNKLRRRFTLFTRALSPS